ncbi:MAG: SUMF1/EgtB/PvdO family nonheme iron enzyme [Candidatus Lindowbacteria bacterium]|nr:SUMF1/EgtB/PvdO family nonheme iron enzyme [Candidatus Lindowbacteria bacterium]
MEEKAGKQSTVVIIAVIMVLLIIGGLFYQRSVERQKKAEEQQQTADQTRIAKEAEAKRKELKAGEAPAQPLRTEPAVAPPSPPPSTGACVTDSVEMIQARVAAAPEGMVYVAAGPFLMGSAPEVGQPDESPVHGVCLSGFYIDKYEVTNAQFKKFVDATGYITDAEMAASPEASLPTWRHPYGADSNADSMPNHPVVCVSWNDANAYALWAGKRLPTEGLTWSNASFSDNQKKTAPVGSFPGGKSVYAAEDMAGNVWEWCFDWWNRAYYQTSPPTGPTGPQAGEFKIIRGGSWFYSVDGARTFRRMYFRPAGSSADIGFRCVKDVQ